MDYLSLITSEHRGQPKFTAWLNSVLGIVRGAKSLVDNLYTYYDIDRATGVQLDSIGQTLGMPRKLPFQPSNNVSAIMDDANYRIVLKAMIARAHFDGTVPGLYNLFQTVLSGTGLNFVVIDNQDMSLSVIAYGVTNSLIKDVLEQGYIVPHPEGVRISVSVVSSKIFSWGVSNDIFSGWGTGFWTIQTGNEADTTKYLLLYAGKSTNEIRTVLSAGDSSSTQRTLLKGRDSNGTITL